MPSLGRAFVLGSSALLFTLLVFSLTPITSPLPPYTGSYTVGILDLETPFLNPRKIHNATLMESGLPAFNLETLAVTLYYPSSIPPLPEQPWARPWLPQPVSLIGKGYARLVGIRWAPLQAVFTGTLWALGGKTVIPGVVGAPILSAEGMSAGSEGEHEGKVVTKVGMGGKVKDEKNLEEVLELRDDGEYKHSPNTKIVAVDGLKALPCVVFTHGMAGMSQSYSHYLGSIASHGYVVAAVEHRDGSGPGSIVHSPNGGEREVWHMSLGDLQADPPISVEDLKVAQLAFREAEMQETISLFKRMNDGDESRIHNLRSDSSGFSLAGFRDRLDLSAVTIAGHSYGATGAMQALKKAPNANMPINGAIALDPGKDSGPLNDEIELPTLVIQSGQWTEKQTEFYGQGWHFDVVKDIVKKSGMGWFMTLAGSAHPSCTDAPLIVPWIMKLATKTTLDGGIALREYIAASVAFLDYLQSGRTTGILKSGVTSAAGPLGEKSQRRRVEGPLGAEWEVHVVPF